MISVSQLSMRFGAKILFKNVSIQFNPGNHYGLIGANGCGKSTFLKILEGDVTPESGNIAFPNQLNLGILKQDHFMYENEKIIDIVIRGRRHLWAALEKQKKLFEKEVFSEDDCEELNKWEKIVEAEGGYSAEADAGKLLEGLGIRDQVHHQPLSALSGGYKLRVLLAQVLFGKPDILLLDEPTNHLDLNSIKWLEGYLKNFPGTLLVISHDRDFLNGVCNYMTDFDYGTVKIFKGNYDTFLELKKEERSLKEATLSKQEKRRDHLQDFVDRFGAKASKAKQAQSKARMVEKIEKDMDSIDVSASSRIYPNVRFIPLRASGAVVLKAENISKAYESKKVLENVSFELERGERLAIIGPNGIGKSTLLGILTGGVKADQGSFTWGFAARVAYFPQDYSSEFRESITLLDWLGQFDTTLPQERLREILGRVLFSGDTVNHSVQTLSGGEKARLILARMMLQKPNVLIFDEPTNHLDMEAIDELTEALQEFDGTVLLVSHNRYFVSHIATRILEITFKGVQDYRCTYPEYIEKQENDFLLAQKALSRRYEHEEVKAPAQKREKSNRPQLKREMEKAEQACHNIEAELNTIQALMEVDGYYEKTPLDEQKKVMREKDELEVRLQKAMEAWENATALYENS